ncbi:MAG TPA: hypothetical protein VM008_10345 [Phycisphaerae bacterium]|nr:hypothetical protein [Phycisphaerae bacterium]
MPGPIASPTLDPRARGFNSGPMGSTPHPEPIRSEPAHFSAPAPSAPHESPHGANTSSSGNGGSNSGGNSGKSPTAPANAAHGRGR